MGNEADIITAYDRSAFIEKFSQDGPGTDEHMEPLAEHTKVEQWNSDGTPYLEEYRGSGKLSGKKIIVTGGDSGIGRSVSIFAAREGADVTIVYLKEEQQDADKTSKLIEQAGRTCLSIAADLKDYAECEKVIKSHLERFGQLDVLVNNAAMQVQCQNLTEIDLSIVEKTFQTNITAMIALTKFALPHMKRGSSIVNSSSVTAFKGSQGMLDYSCTKGAITSFTRSLALQQTKNGIRVNCVAPGPVYTPLQPASRTPEQMEGWGLGSIPLHGRVAQPAEMAAAYIFLASSDSNFMTGATLHINGGQYYA